MRFGRRTIMVVGTFLLAAATGHVMQNADTIAARLRGEAPATARLTQASLTSGTAEPAAAAPAADAAALAQAVRATLPDFPDLPGLHPNALPDGIRLAARVGDVMADYQPPMTAVLREYDIYGRVCAEPALTLTHLKPAMIGVSVAAPCHPGEVMTVSHAGLSFAAATDDRGRFTATVPALAAGGAIDVQFELGTALSGRVLVPDLGSVSRFALVTRAQSGLHLHAYVKGAGQGAAGHIRPGNDGLPTLGLGGYLTRLGDPALAVPRLAEIFTQPARNANARVQLVAEVDDGNCGRDLLGMAFAAEGTVVPVTGAVSFAMPGCDAIGDRLALDVTGAAIAPLARAAD